jgi:hypothetical protein
LAVNYRICEADTAKKLEKRVNRLIAEGWRPAGSLAVAQSHASGKWWFYQAMTQEAWPSEESVEVQKAAMPGVGDFD